MINLNEVDTSWMRLLTEDELKILNSSLIEKDGKELSIDEFYSIWEFATLYAEYKKSDLEKLKRNYSDLKKYYKAEYFPIAQLHSAKFQKQFAKKFPTLYKLYSDICNFKMKDKMLPFIEVGVNESANWINTFIQKQEKKFTNLNKKFVLSIKTKTLSSKEQELVMKHIVGKTL